jgi:hypothetical protein
VREDYSSDGECWDYFPHDHARSRTYRWGEDGLLGISDRQGRLCFALALWNGADPILKERLFGLTGPEGNHGEDVKEQYFYLDSTPTHSIMKALYKYPQRAFPYDRLVEENRRRGRHEPEFELGDTGVFDDHRYFDVVVEYAKASPDDILIAITLANRGPEAAPSPCCPHSGFEILGRGGAAGKGIPIDPVSGRASKATSRPNILLLAATVCSWTERLCRSSSSPRTRPTPSDCSARQTRVLTSRTPFTSMSCMAGETA